MDKEGPDYTGNVIMAQNLNYNIVSNEDLEAVQAVGMPAQPAGTPGGSAALEEESTGGQQYGDVRCGMQYLPKHEGAGLAGTADGRGCGPAGRISGRRSEDDIH